MKGLGFLPFSNTVHYGGEEGRRLAYHSHVAAGMPGGYAVEDGAALHFVRRELAAVVTSRPHAKAHWVDCGPDGAVEHLLPSRYLGAPAAAESDVAA